MDDLCAEIFKGQNKKQKKIASVEGDKRIGTLSQGLKV